MNPVVNVFVKLLWKTDGTFRKKISRLKHKNNCKSRRKNVCFFLNKEENVWINTYPFVF